ncbi:cathepsin F [Paragonimus westermani]|uniref:Cathepsin F n=1 Tax=Paragonimus westermani TaxID=34504 RepID=A0A5J4P0W6_9TREM|nr:cathepsin F [Paragonimus westermani]
MYQLHDQGTAGYGVTQFSDLTPEEFAAKFLSSRIDSQVEHVQLNDLKAAPGKVDWREKGDVGPVENEGSCRSNWAFSFAGNIEGQWFRKTGQLFDRSKQQLIDCQLMGGGCNDVYSTATYLEIVKMGGLERGEDYPYVAKRQHCQMNPSKIVATIECAVILEEDERKQAAWLAENGPMSVGLNANYLQVSFDFCSLLSQFYRSGINHSSETQCPPADMNHAGLTVGYGVKGDVPYWIVKNRWGESWREKGYFRIYRGNGTCGIHQLATCAVIDQ